MASPVQEEGSLEEGSLEDGQDPGQGREAAQGAAQQSFSGRGGGEPVAEEGHWAADATGWLSKARAALAEGGGSASELNELEALIAEGVQR